MVVVGAKCILAREMILSRGRTMGLCYWYLSHVGMLVHKWWYLKVSGGTCIPCITMIELVQTHSHVLHHVSVVFKEF